MVDMFDQIGCWMLAMMGSCKSDDSITHFATATSLTIDHNHEDSTIRERLEEKKN